LKLFYYLLTTGKEIKMIPTTKCGQCHFQNESKICVNYTCLSYKERVLDGYVSCDRFQPRKIEIAKPNQEMHDALKPGKCQTCMLSEKCRLTPETCPGTLDKAMSEILMKDESPMGHLFKQLIEDIMASHGTKV
jgi:hypothetical protein